MLFANFENICRLSCYFSPQKGIALHFNKFESNLSKYALCKFIIYDIFDTALRDDIYNQYMHFTYNSLKLVWTFSNHTGSIKVKETNKLLIFIPDRHSPVMKLPLMMLEFLWSSICNKNETVEKNRR